MYYKENSSSLQKKKINSSKMSIVNNHPDQTAGSLLKNDPKLSTKEVVIDVAKYGQLASEESIAETKASLEANAHEVSVLSNKVEALEFLKKLIPPNVSVNNGHSTTLEEKNGY